MRDRGLSEHFNKFFYTNHFFLSLLSVEIYWKGFMFPFYNFDNSGAHKLKESFCGAKMNLNKMFQKKTKQTKGPASYTP